MNNACLVVAQFGNGWSYFDLWLASVARQPMDVLFLTDYEFDAPSNVKVVKTSMDDVFDRAESVYDLKFNNRFPYKLCDLKSFYGKLFEDELRDYDYWGYGDTDVIYGNLPRFGDLELYCAKHQRADMELVRSAKPLGKWFIPGHFVMMLNDSRGRRIFEKLPTAKNLLESSSNEYIDEWLVPTVLITEYGLGAGGIKSEDYANVVEQDIRMQNGQLLSNNTEYHYIHWYSYKPRISSPAWREIPASYHLKDFVK